MKKTSLALALVAGIAFSGVTYSQKAEAATSTANIAVSATVLAFCLLTATPLAFGNYTVTAAGATTATVTALCTPGTTYSIALNAGTGTGATVATRLMTSASTATTLGYSIYQDAAHTNLWGNTAGTTVTGTGTGLGIQYTAYGFIPANEYAAPAANYLDTVVATLTY